MKILIVKTSALGDIVHTFDAINAIKTLYPHSSIHWVVEKPFQSLVATHPHVDEIIAIDSKVWCKKIFSTASWRSLFSFCRKLRSNKYNVIFDLQGNIKSAIVTALAKGKDKVGFALKSVAEWPNVLATKKRFNPSSGANIRSDYLSIVEQYFCHAMPSSSSITLQPTRSAERPAEDSPRPSFMVCPGAAWRNKKLPIPTLIAFLKALERRYQPFYHFIWGSEEEKKEAEQLHTAFANSSSIVDKMPLNDLQNAMDDSDVVIAMDSLPLHLAATTSAATFSLFGASSALKYAPVGPQHAHWQGACPYNLSFTKRCPKLRSCPTGLCIRNADPNDLANLFSRWYETQVLLNK